MPLRLVGTRSRAIRRRTSKQSANGKKDRERASAPIAQVRVRRSSKKKRRDVQRRTRGSASRTGAGGAARSYHFNGAYQRFNSNQKQRPSCQSSLGAAF